MAAPPGTSGAALTRLLIGQGFQINPKPCPQLPSVKLATFRQHRGGGLTYEGWATVWWAIDEQDRVAWTSGNIIYSGL